jgi:hypothetical protein
VQNGVLILKELPEEYLVKKDVGRFEVGMLRKPTDTQQYL